MCHTLVMIKHHLIFLVYDTGLETLICLQRSSSCQPCLFIILNYSVKKDEIWALLIGKRRKEVSTAQLVSLFYKETRASKRFICHID